MRQHNILCPAALIVAALLVASAMMPARRVAAETGQVVHGEPLTLVLPGDVVLELVWIAPGRSEMGSEEGEPDERPVHRVSFSKGFWIGAFEVTQEQFKAVTGYNPSHFKSDTHPVETVSQIEDVKAFMDGLLRRGAVPPGYLPRLPTEAEWEHVCRAGSEGTYSFGSEAGALQDHGWYLDNSGGSTHPVGGKKPNAFGVYDMHGNVWEWCSDWYMETYYELSGEDVAPVGPSAGGTKALRGGSWANKAKYCRSSNRFRYRPWSKDDSVGFRLVVQER